MHVDFLSTNSAERKICQLPRHKYHFTQHLFSRALLSDLIQSCRIEEIPQDDRVKSYSFTLSMHSKITSINKILRCLPSFLQRHMYTHELMGTTFE